MSEDQYKIIWPDGQEFGPISANTVATWIEEGRITRDTQVLDIITDRRMPASEIVDDLELFPAVVPEDPELAISEWVSMPDPPPRIEEDLTVSYFVLGPDGSKYGPSGINTLNLWASEGRITAETYLEDANTGQQLLATSLPGLLIPGFNSGATIQPRPFQKEERQPWRKTMDSPTLRPDGRGISMEGQGAYNTSLALGIIGIILGFASCCSVVGLILGIIGLSKAGEAERLGYDAKVAVIINWIAIVIGGLAIVGGIVVMAVMPAFSSSWP